MVRRKQRDGIRPMGPGRWQVRVSAGPRTQPDGTIRYPELSRVVHGTRADAAEARLLLMADAGKRVSSEQLTVRALLERWLETKAEDLEARTAADYRRYLDRYLIPAFGDRPVPALTTMEVEAQFRRWRDAGLAPRTIKLVQTPLAAAYSAALDRWGLVRSNPVRAARIPGKQREKQWVLPTADQLITLVRCAFEVAPLMQVLAVLAAGSGMRRGEMVALQWEDIDTKAEEIRVHRAVSEVGGRLLLKDTKTHQVRVVHVPTQVLTVLDAWRVRQAEAAAATGYPPGPWIAAFDGHQIIWPQTVTAWWRQTCKAAGVEGVRLHDLRHAYATWALGHGLTPLDVAKQLGHESPMMTLTVYGHAQATGQRAVADAIAGHLPQLGA